jgi:hypothetical protein
LPKLKIGDVLGGFEVDAGEAQHRFRDYAHIAFDGRPDLLVAAVDGQIDRDIGHARAFGEVHAEEKDVRPSAVAQVEADGRRFLQNGVEERAFGPLEQLGADSHRMILGVADAEHPLVAFARADASTHLVRERLEREMVVCLGQCAREGGVEAVASRGAAKRVDGLLETAAEEVRIALRGDRAGVGEVGGLAEMETVDGIEK